MPFQQTDTQARLQLGDLFADGRLTGMQHGGGLGEAALMHDFDKTAQLFEFHRLIPFWNGVESNNSLRG